MKREHIPRKTAAKVRHWCVDAADHFAAAYYDTTDEHGYWSDLAMNDLRRVLTELGYRLEVTELPKQEAEE